MFKVEIVQDEHQEGVRWLKASHNGLAWSLIEFRSNEEARQIMVALQQSVQADGANVTAECKHGIYGACADCAIESMLPASNASR